MTTLQAANLRTIPLTSGGSVVVPFWLPGTEARDDNGNTFVSYTYIQRFRSIADAETDALWDAARNLGLPQTQQSYENPQVQRAALALLNSHDWWTV